MGVSDFGLFNLVAGVIVLLSFANGALSISGQRFFSIALGEGDNKKLNNYFNSSLGIHVLFAICISILLLLLEPFLFNGFLSISDEQTGSAIQVYQILIISSFITVLSIPLSAIANAYEDLTILSIADIVSNIIKLIGAYALVFFEEKLIAYSLVMLGSIVLKLLIELIWCIKKYCHIKFSINKFYDKAIWHSMLSFVSYNTLGSLAVIVRSQGIAVLFNIYFGTIINASYGIANQINSLVLSFAAAITTVFAPTIIRSYGAGDTTKTIETAFLSCKLSFFLSSIMALPMLVYLDEILDIWLDCVPPHTNIFTIFIIFSFLILQLYPGLNRAIYATGNIKKYQILLSVAIMGVIPVGVLFFELNLPDYSLLIVLLVSQVITLILTIILAKELLGIKDAHIWRDLVIRPSTLFIAALCMCLFIRHLTNSSNIIEIVLYSLLFVSIYALAYYKTILNKTEQLKVHGLANQILNKLGIKNYLL